MRVCPAIKTNGERCKGIVGTASDYCPAHDPARKGARRTPQELAATFLQYSRLRLFELWLEQVTHPLLLPDERVR